MWLASLPIPPITNPYIIGSCRIIVGGCHTRCQHAATLSNLGLVKTCSEHLGLKTNMYLLSLSLFCAFHYFKIFSSLDTFPLLHLFITRCNPSNYMQALTPNATNQLLGWFFRLWLYKIRLVLQLNPRTLFFGTFHHLQNV